MHVYVSEKKQEGQQDRNCACVHVQAGGISLI